MLKSESWSPLERQETQLLPKPPNHPFFLKWHPSNLMFCYFDIGKGKKVESKGFFIPHIRMEYIKPGINGVHQIDKELGNPASRIGTLQSKGWIYLDPRQHDYIKMYKVHGGRYHIPNWVDLKVIAGKVLEKSNQVQKNKWIVSQVLNGVLSAPEIHFMELEILENQKHPEKLIHNQHIPEIKRRIESQYKLIDDMKLFVSEYTNSGLEIYRQLFNNE